MRSVTVHVASVKSYMRDFIYRDKRRSIAIIGIGSVVIVMLLLMPYLSRVSARRLLASSFSRFMQAKSFHTATSLSLELPVRLQNRERPILSVRVAVDGDVAYNGSTPMFSGSLKTEARGRGMILFSDGELRLLPDVSIFRLAELPAILNPKGNLVEKWTYVQASTLTTNNTDQVQTALRNLVSGMTYEGNEDVDGIRSAYFLRNLTAEQEGVLERIFQHTSSGNHGLHVVARLLHAFDVRALEVWVDRGNKSVRRIQATFARPSDAAGEHRAILVMSFSDYDKALTIDKPPQELSVNPSVFAKLFGQGNLNPIN